MTFSFNKSEKLKSEKLISALFSSGKSISAYPLRLVYLKTTFENDIKLKTGVSVPKRNFKKAVDRIRIKRQMREAYRLNKAMVFNNITTQYAFMILYISKEKSDYNLINSKTQKLFRGFLEACEK